MIRYLSPTPSAIFSTSANNTATNNNQPQQQRRPLTLPARFFILLSLRSSLSDGNHYLPSPPNKSTMAPLNNFASAALSLIFLASQQSSAFVIAPRPKSQSKLQMAATAPPPPPAQEKVAVTAAPVQAAPSKASNLPSDKELLAKASASSSTSTPAPAPAPAPAPKSKSANVASGTGIIISDVRFDGIVPKTESDEYVIIANNGKTPVDVSGYYVYVATAGTQGPTFYFPKKTVPLKAGESVRVYTNEVHKENGGYSFGSGKAIWSNNGGLAVLKDGNGKKIGEYKYAK